MGPIDRCLASMARLSLAPALRPSASSIPPFLAPALVQSRQASVVRLKKAKKKRPVPKNFPRPDLKKREWKQYSLCEAMRILRASQVGTPPASVKYDVAISLKTNRSGPVVRGSLRLPNPVKSDWLIAVICPEGGDVANAATSAGAVAVGEESLFEAIREGKIEFDRLLCHEASEKALNKAGLGKVLGPRGLMPNHRNRTIVADVAKSIRDSSGAADYRERMGVVRMSIGQLGFTPIQLRANIQAVMKKVKTECADIAEDFPKEVHEVVLSTTHGPALSLKGTLVDPEDSVTPEQLLSPM